jgi:hypothetical protein
MRSGEKRIAVLEELDERQRASQHHWVVDEEGHLPCRRDVETVVGEGLAELADRETRAELSAYAARPVHWAARLTGHGRDVLVFARSRALAEPEVYSPTPGEQLVELRPAQMVALRVLPTSWRPHPPRGSPNRSAPHAPTPRTSGGSCT